MYSSEPLHMDEQGQDDQSEPIYSSSVSIRDIALKTCRKQWTIAECGERGSGISVLMVRQDDNEDDIKTKFVRGCSRGVIVKAMDCGIVVSEFVLQSRYYVHFQANTLGKVWTPLSSQLWVKLQHSCSSRRMALALNNIKRVDMPLNKETKPKFVNKQMYIT